MKNCVKKLTLTLLAASLIACCASCTSNTPGTDDGNTIQGEQLEENNGTQSNEAKTFGNKLAEEFLKNADGTCEEIANKLVENPEFPFSSMVQAMPEGLLPGFDNTEISGFSECVLFGPMIGAIPFVGYIFEVKEGGSVDEFKKLLSDNANRRWNVCVEADETVIESSGNKVFFVMSPSSFDEDEADDGFEEFEEDDSVELFGDNEIAIGIDATALDDDLDNEVSFDF